MLGSFVQFFLNGFKQFLADDGFMGAVDNRPFHFADFDLLVVYNFCAALHQIAGVNLRVKDSCHRAGVPVPIGYIDSISHVTVSTILKKTNLSLT